MLPRELLDWTSFRRFKRSLERKALGDNQNYTFCTGFDKSLNGVSFPRSLQNRSFGDGFNQALGASTFPSSLQNLTFGDEFDQSLQGVTLHSGLQSCFLVLTSTRACQAACQAWLSIASSTRVWNKYFCQATLKAWLWVLSSKFNQSLERVSFPSSLLNLTLGDEFKQSVEAVTFPSNLEKLTFGHAFNQSLELVSLPNTIESLTFGAWVVQSRGWVWWLCQAVFKAWISDVNWTRACRMWCCLANF